MRRISRARSLVSGVEVWHPAKPLLENRVEFVHCIVIIMHCLLKTIFFAKPDLFSKRPILIQMQSPVSGLFLFECYRFANGVNKTNKNYIIFSGGSRTGQIDPNDHPQDFKSVQPVPPLIPKPTN